MKILNIIYSIFGIFAALAVILLAVSVFPITGNYKIYVVQSGSMEPAIHTGSVVVVLPEKDYKEGDIITFKSKGGKPESVTHRIVKAESNGPEKIFTTKGDANKSNDTDSVSSEKVIGKMLFTVPYFGYAVAAAKTKYGFLALIIIPALLIVYDEIKKILEELRKSKNKKEEGLSR